MIHIRSHQVKVNNSWGWGYKTLCNCKVDYAPTKPVYYNRAEDHCKACLSNFINKKEKELDILKEMLIVLERES